MDRDRAGSEEEVALRQQTDSQREREREDVVRIDNGKETGIEEVRSIR